jgi:1,4-alpha-glucan branching enzyme
MIRLEQPNSPLRHVGFEFYAPTASEVFLVGEFNDWDAASVPLRRSADGNWRVELMLPAGIHRYKFVVDSVWRCSPDQPHDRCARPGEACPRCVPNLLGSFDRIVIA